MSQPSRAERRQASRGGPTSHPPKRDPMIPIYIGIAVVVAAIFVAFGISKWRSDAMLSAAMATPTPGPAAGGKGVELLNGVSVGKTTFPPGDTKDGGNGAPVDGIQCQTTEQVTLHIHSHLALFVNGKQIEVPKYIGLAPTSNGGCLYWLHTHDPSGIIHIEAPDLQSPKGGPYTLGMLFDIWGQPLDRGEVATFKGAVTAYVNGEKYDGALSDIPLLAHQNITLEVGTPLVVPPHYLFPEGD